MTATALVQATQVRNTRYSRPSLHDTDPIFDAIDRHKAAVLASLEAKAAYYRDQNSITDAEDAKAFNAAEEAALALASTAPTTFAGIMALLAHVDEFNRGAISIAVCGFEADRFYTDCNHWPDEGITRDDVRTFYSNKAVPMTLPWWLLRNVHKSLDALSGAAIKSRGQ